MGHWVQNIVLFFSLLWMLACGEKNTCFETAGTNITIKQNLGNFGRILLYDNIDVTIYPDSVNYALITTGENLLDGITLNITTDTLIIQNKNNCPWAKGYDYNIQVDVHCDTLYWFYYDGSGNISFADTLRVHRFVFESLKSSGNIELLLNVDRTTLYNFRGTADITYAGICRETFKLSYEASGKVNSLNMPAGKMDIMHRGTNDIYVYVKEELNATIDYVGNIYYKGGPTIIENTETHQGRLIPYNP